MQQYLERRGIVAIADIDTRKLTRLLRDQGAQSGAIVADTSSPAYTTQLPGVSANDMPGFRRHMYRTDI